MIMETPIHFQGFPRGKGMGDGRESLIPAKLDVSRQLTLSVFIVAKSIGMKDHNKDTYDQTCFQIPMMKAFFLKVKE